MYIPIDIKSSEKKRETKQHFDFVESINVSVQYVNVINLMQVQQNNTMFFLNEYNRLNRIGWANIFDTERNINDASQFHRLRNKGVKTAWQYEKASIKLGGNGTANWNRSEKEQILKFGKVKGAQGHHQMNVHHHPDFMSEASNIKFYKNGKDHLHDGHGGNFRNESDKPFVDRDRQLINDYENGKVKMEIYSAVIAVTLGFALNSSISLVIELSENGIDSDSLKLALENASYEGFKGALTSSVYYGLYRGGEIGLDMLVNYMRSGMSLSPKLADFLKATGTKMGIIGSLIIFADGVWQTSKSINKGESYKVAIQNSAAKEVVPIGLLALSVINVPIGICASVAAILMDAGFLVRNYRLNKKLEDFEMNCVYNHLSQKIQNCGF